MALLSNTIVFDAAFSGADVWWYSPAQLNEVLGAGSKFMVSMHVTQGTPDLQMQIEFHRSADNVNWFYIRHFLDDPIPSSWYGASTYDEPTSDLPGKYQRLALMLTGPSPSAFVHVRLVARTRR